MQIFAGQKVVVDGTFVSDRAAIEAGLIALGAQIGKYTRKADLLVIGAASVYFEAAQKASIPIVSEGELLAHLRGGIVDAAPLWPNGANLGVARVLGKEGQTNIKGGPTGLVCHWKRIDFRVDPWFAETHGFGLASHPQYLGRFEVDGQALAPQEEVFSYARFDTLGNDYEADRVVFSAEHGLNVTTLVRVLTQRKPGSWAWNQGRLEFESEEMRSGPFNNMVDYETYRFDLDANTASYDHTYHRTDLRL